MCDGVCVGVVVAPENRGVSHGIFNQTGFVYISPGEKKGLWYPYDHHILDFGGVAFIVNLFTAECHWCQTGSG